MLLWSYKLNEKYINFFCERNFFLWSEEPPSIHISTNGKNVYEHMLHIKFVTIKIVVSSVFPTNKIWLNLLIKALRQNSTANLSRLFSVGFSSDFNALNIPHTGWPLEAKDQLTIENSDQADLTQDLQSVLSF